MSFFRNLFESKPAQTDQEYTVSLIDQLFDGKASPYLISNLKEFSHEYPDEISSRGIPELVKALAKFPENDDVAKDLITIFADLLRSDNLKKEENAKTFLECEDTIPNFVRNLDNKTPQIRVGSMHVLMMIANLQPSLFTESLTSHQPQMIRLFGSISDQNEQISSKFVSVIPKLVENNPDFQQIVGFYAFEALVNSINRERPEFLEALISVLKDNQISQSLFVNSGYLSTIDKMLRTPDEKILDLMLIIFDPYKNSNNLESFRKNLESTNIINTLCDNIIKNVYRPLNAHLLSVCIKGNSELTNNTREKIPDFVRLALEIRKSATVNNGNNSFLDGLDLFGEFFENFVFESDDNSHFLNLTIISSQNIGFDGLSESFLNLVTFSCLVAPNCKSDFEEIFNSLISNLRRYETVSSMFKFFVCFCWQSKEHCDMISTEDKLTILIQLLINDKNNNNAFFVPNSDSNSNEKRNHFLLLLFAEIILFSGKNRAKIGSIVNTSILPIELEESINQFENSEFKDNSKFGQLEKQIIQYISENHLQDALNQDDNDDNDFYKSEYSRLKAENRELNEKLTRNEDDLNSIKIENDEKSNQIKSLLSQIDDLTNNNVNVISKDVQLKDEIGNNDSQQNLENKLKELQNENQSIKELNNQLTQENQSIKEQNKMIQEQNSNLQEEIEKSKQNQNLNHDDLVNKLNSEIENLTKQLEEKDTSHKEIADNLMNQINELKSQIEDKNVRLQNEESSQLQLRGEIDDLSSKLAESNNSYESLQEQNRISSNELDQLRSSLENAKNISEDFQKQISEKNNSISSLKSQNEQLKNKIEKKSIETTEIIEKFNKEISELRSQQNLAGGELISSLNNQIEELKNENNQQKHEFENEKEILNQSISKLQSENNRLEDDCNSLLDVKAKLQEEENKHENNEKLLTSKNDELQKQIKEIESLNAQKIEAITLSFNTEKEKLLIEKESLKAQIEKLKENEQSNKDETDSLRRQISEMKEVTLPINEVESIRKENVEITKKCSELNSKVNELQNKLNQDQNNKNSETKLDEKNNIDELLRIKVSELENQIEQYKIECIEKDDSISALTAQVKEAKKVQKANDKVAADLRKANSDLQDQVNHMLKQIEELQLLTQYKNLLNLNSPKGNNNNQQKQSKSSSKVADRDLQFEVEISKNSKSTKSSNSNSNEIESNSSVIKNFKQQNEQLNNQVNNLQNDNQNLQIQLNESKSKETEKSNQIIQLQKVIEKLQKEKETLQEEIQTQKSNKDKKSENNTNNIKDKNINNSSDELAKSLKEQNKEIINTMNKIKNENKLIQEQDLDDSLLNDINYSFEEEEEIKNDEANTQNKNKNENQNQTQTQKVQSNSQPNNNTNNDFASDSSFSNTKSNLESIVAKQRKLINDLRAQNQKLEANGIEATTNAENLASENEKLKADFKRSQQEAASIVQKLKKKLTIVANEKSKLQSQINEIQAKNEQRKEQSKDTENTTTTTNSTPPNKKIQELQSQISLLKAENEKLKNTPTKALVNALQEEKANLEEKVYKLNDELSKLKKEINKEKENDSNNDLLSSFPISPIQQKTAKKSSKSSKPKSSTKNKHTSSNRDFDDAEILDKLLTENEILKRDNENQSHTITDLQLMLEMQNIESDSQFSIPNNSGFNGYNKYHLPYASFDEELKNLSVENEVLNSKLNEMKAIEAENKRLQNENTELKRLIRNRTPSFVSENEVSKRDSPNLSELKQKKALRVIGKLYLDKQQQKLNM